MRDPDRIDIITEKFKTLWHEVPDFRFWQVIQCLFEKMPEEKSGSDPFYWEDDVWNTILDGMLNRYS